MAAITCALSAICGTHFGLTKLVTSISRRPAACSRCTSSTLCASPPAAASFCRPSRGPTSTRVTCQGSWSVSGRVDGWAKMTGGDMIGLGMVRMAAGRTLRVATLAMNTRRRLRIAERMRRCCCVSWARAWTLRMVAEPLYARDVLLVCDAMPGTELATLAQQFRVAANETSQSEATPSRSAASGPRARQAGPKFRKPRRRARRSRHWRRTQLGFRHEHLVAPGVGFRIRSVDAGFAICRFRPCRVASRRPGAGLRLCASAPAAKTRPKTQIKSCKLFRSGIVKLLASKTSFISF